MYPYIFQVVFLNPEYKLWHDDHDVIYETQCLGDASLLMKDAFTETGNAVAVYNKNANGYQDIMRNPRRDKLGRFSTFLNSVN